MKNLLNILSVVLVDALLWAADEDMVYSVGSKNTGIGY